ncbi:MAG: bile acid:sodium symporter family protein [Myxococcota bacterium]
MKESLLTSLVLPLSLFVIMLGMGLSLTRADFSRLLRRPKAFSIGLFNQILVLPFLGFVLALSLALDPIFAVGLILISACPGGVTSNLITHVSRGDTALSISLTAVNSFITVFTLPAVVGLALESFLDGGFIELPFLETVGKIFGITVLPVTLGMILKGRAPALAARMERPVRVASTLLFVLIVVGIIAANMDLLREHLPRLLGVLLTLNLLTMGLGFGVSRLAGLTQPEAICITIESGIQNGTLAIVIATSILQRGDLALPGACYSLIMFATGGAMMAYFGTGRRPRWLPDDSNVRI